jgi:hypothetical protein
MNDEKAQNLYCYCCGNKHQWQIDLRLIHTVIVDEGNILIELDSGQTTRVLSSIERNLQLWLEKSSTRIRSIFHCAMCHNDELETRENALENCYNVGCPGCVHCENYIDIDEMKEICIRCIQEYDGDLDDDYCNSCCPHFDYGLEPVRQHYNVTLDELIKEAGY